MPQIEVLFRRRRGHLATTSGLPLDTLPMLIRVITDGKAGDLVQCLGVAEQVIALAGGSIEERMVRPRFLFSLAMPWGPADPRDGEAVSEPYPDIAIASGRRAV